MKLNYSLGIMGMIGTLFLNYPGFTQVTKFDVNQGTSKPPKIYFGLQTDSAPISDKDPVGNWQGYCIAFIEILEKQTHLNIVRVPIESQDRFTGIGNHGQKLDAECGSDTITEDRKIKDLKNQNGNFSKPFAFTGTKILVSDENKIYFNENNQNILQSLKFGVLNKTTAKSLVENRYRYNDNIIILKDRTDAFKQIKDGKIDAYFNDEPILNEMIKSLKPLKYSILPGRLSEEHYGIVVFHVDQDQKNRSLLDTINKLLDEPNLETFGDTQIRMFNSPEFNEFRQHIQDLNPRVNSPPKPVNSTPQNSSNGHDFLQRNNRYILFSLGLISIFLFIVILLIKNRRTNLSRIHTLFPQFLDAINVIIHNHLHTENDNTQRDNMSESYQSNYDQRESNNQFVNTAQSGSNPTFNQSNYAPEQKHNLAQAAAEIQQLLYQLSQTSSTTDEAITEAIHQEIKHNPTLKARLKSALKAGGLEALKAIFNHPLFNIPAETIKGFLEAE